MIDKPALALTVLTGTVAVFVGATAAIAASRGDWPWFYALGLIAFLLAGLCGGLAPTIKTTTDTDQTDGE